jgi:hypothetical protein
VGVLDSRSYDGAGKLLAELAVSHPRSAYAVASFLGALRNRVTRRWPSTREVRTLFPHLDVRSAAILATRIGALHERNRVLVRCMQLHDLESVRPFVFPGEALAAISGPCILATFHVGAIHATAAALVQLRSPVLSLRAGRLFTPRPPLETISTDGTAESRAAVVLRALKLLRDGGIVVLAPDVVQDQFTETQCLGRTLKLAPGAFVLAQSSGAPIRPMTARWQGSTVRVDVGAPIVTPHDAAAWLERYLLASPSELTLGLLRMLLGVS